MSRRWRFRLPVYAPSSDPGLVVRVDLDNETAADGDCGVRNTDCEDECDSAIVRVRVGRSGECSRKAPGRFILRSMALKRGIGQAVRLMVINEEFYSLQ